MCFVICIEIKFLTLLAIAKLLIRSTIRLLPHPSQALSLLDKAAAAAEASVLREQVKQLEALKPMCRDCENGGSNVLAA